MEMPRKVAFPSRTAFLGGLFFLLFFSGPSPELLGATEPEQGGKLPPGSDRSLLSVALKDFRSQHDRMARKAIKELLSSHPGSLYRGPALLLLARLHAREAIEKGSGDFREPLAYFRKAQETPPSGWDRGEVLFREGQYLIRQRFGAEGRGILSQLLSRFPDSPWAFRARLATADSWRERGNLRRADKILDEARASLTKSSPETERIRYLYLQGHLRLDRGDLPGAETAFLSALSLSKSYPYHHPGALFLLARTAYALGHNHRSAALFKSFARLFPNDPRSGESEYYLARISGRMGFLSHEKARLREVVADYPGSAASHLARTELLRLVFFSPEKGESRRDLPELLSRSIRELGKIASEERNRRISGEAALLRLRLMDRAGDWEGAIRKISRLEGAIDPASRFGMRLRRLEASLVMNRISQLSHPLHARQILDLYNSYRYRLPLASDPGGAALFLSLARANWKNGEKERAGRELDSVLAHGQDPVLLAIARKVRYRWLIQDGKKSRALDWAITFSGNRTIPSPERREWFGKALDLARQMKRPEIEREVLASWAVSGVPIDHPGEVLARLGLLEIGSGNPDKGRSDLMRALPLIEGRKDDRPLLAQVLFRLGQESLLRGDRPSSRRYWKEMLACCSSDPHGGWVTYQMGQMALSEGHAGEALEWFEKTVKKYPGEEVARVAREKIRAMRLENKNGEPR